MLLQAVHAGLAGVALGYAATLPFVERSGWQVRQLAILLGVAIGGYALQVAGALTGAGLER